MKASTQLYEVGLGETAYLNFFVLWLFARLVTAADV